MKKTQPVFIFTPSQHRLFQLIFLQINDNGVNKKLAIFCLQRLRKFGSITTMDMLFVFLVIIFFLTKKYLYLKKNLHYFENNRVE